MNDSFTRSASHETIRKHPYYSTKKTCIHFKDTGLRIKAVTSLLRLLIGHTITDIFSIVIIGVAVGIGIGIDPQLLRFSIPIPIPIPIPE
ncbi:MAG: hypothetical protein JW915_18685 [Chitinispirillaceae bacterium]|nr:hypothetical protein [Chitinispirillaceae bacterium]